MAQGKLTKDAIRTVHVKMITIAASCQYLESGLDSISDVPPEVGLALVLVGSQMLHCNSFKVAG